MYKIIRASDGQNAVYFVRYIRRYLCHLLLRHINFDASFVLTSYFTQHNNPNICDWKTFHESFYTIFRKQREFKQNLNVKEKMKEKKRQRNKKRRR